MSPTNSPQFINLKHNKFAIMSRQWSNGGIALLIITTLSLISFISAIAECEKPADVVFVLDTSNSIWLPDFKKQLRFVRALINEFTIGEDNMRVGVIAFSDHPQLQFHLNRFYKKKDVKQAVSRMRQYGGIYTYTHDAIDYMRTQAFLPENGARRNVTKIGIVITDGRSYDKTQTAHEARLAQDDGIHMLAIGVGSRVDRSELDKIASSPSSYYSFMVQNYDGLNRIKELLVIKTCTVTHAPSTTLPPTTTTSMTTTVSPSTVVTRRQIRFEPWTTPFYATEGLNLPFEEFVESSRETVRPPDVLAPGAGIAGEYTGDVLVGRPDEEIYGVVNPGFSNNNNDSDPGTYIADWLDRHVMGGRRGNGGNGDEPDTGRQEGGQGLLEKTPGQEPPQEPGQSGPDSSKLVSGDPDESTSNHHGHSGQSSSNSNSGSESTSGIIDPSWGQNGHPENNKESMTGRHSGNPTENGQEDHGGLTGPQGPAGGHRHKNQLHNGRNRDNNGNGGTPHNGHRYNRDNDRNNDRSNNGGGSNGNYDSNGVGGHHSIADQDGLNGHNGSGHNAGGDHNGITDPNRKDSNGHNGDGSASDPRQGDSNNRRGGQTSGTGGRSTLDNADVQGGTHGGDNRAPPSTYYNRDNPSGPGNGLMNPTNDNRDYGTPSNRDQGSHNGNNNPWWANGGGGNNPWGNHENRPGGGSQTGPNGGDTNGLGTGIAGSGGQYDPNKWPQYPSYYWRRDCPTCPPVRVNNDRQPDNNRNNGNNRRDTTKHHFQYEKLLSCPTCQQESATDRNRGNSAVPGTKDMANDKDRRNGFNLECPTCTTNTREDPAKVDRHAQDPSRPHDENLLGKVICPTCQIRREVSRVCPTCVHNTNNHDHQQEEPDRTAPGIGNQPDLGVNRHTHGGNPHGPITHGSNSPSAALPHNYTHQGCTPPSPTDLVFVIDSTYGGDEGQRHFWHFVKDVVSRLDMDDGRFRVQFVHECISFPDVQLNLYDKTHLLRELNAMAERPRQTASLLRSMSGKIASVQQPFHERRKVGIYVTDDKLGDLREAMTAAREAREQFGVDLYTVGVGPRVDQSELRRIVSADDRNHVHVIPDVNRLPIVTRHIARQLCTHHSHRRKSNS